MIETATNETDEAAVELLDYRVNSDREALNRVRPHADDVLRTLAMIYSFAYPHDAESYWRAEAVLFDRVYAATTNADERALAAYRLIERIATRISDETFPNARYLAERMVWQVQRGLLALPGPARELRVVG